MTQAGWCDVCLLNSERIKAVARISIQRDCPHCRELGKLEGKVVTADACRHHLNEALDNPQACEHGTPLHFSEPIPLL
jgi:hypothetical protein